jgi:hypothetical protein
MNRHSIDPLSLVFGIVFALVGGVILGGHVDAAQLHLDRVWPIPLVVLGAAIILLATGPGRRHAEQRSDEDEATDASRQRDP